MNAILIILAVCYCLVILFIHSKIMQICSTVKATPDNKRVIGIITDTRPNNYINKDLK